MVDDYDGPTAGEVYDHLAELAVDAGADFDPETMRDSVEDMTDEQLEEYYDYEDWDAAAEASAADEDHPLKYH